MKRLITIVLAVCMVMLATACGEVSDRTNNSKQEQQSVSETALTTTTSITSVETTSSLETTTSETTSIKAVQPKANKNSISSDLIDFNDSELSFIGTNYDGGLIYVWFAKYIGKKDIKYYTIHYKMLNSVGDPANNEDGTNLFREEIAGPVYSGDYLMDIQKDRPSTNCKMCYTLQLESIDLEYVDGTTDSISVGWSSEIMSADYHEDKLNDAWNSAWLYIVEKHEEFCKKMLT